MYVLSWWTVYALTRVLFWGSNTKITLSWAPKELATLVIHDDLYILCVCEYNEVTHYMWYYISYKIVI